MTVQLTQDHSHDAAQRNAGKLSTKAVCESSQNGTSINDKSVWAI